MNLDDLQIRELRSSNVVHLGENHWRLELPAGGDEYRLTQLDDYMHLTRDNFRWEPPFSMNLTARVSNQEIPGTWGFGFWNDPFVMGLSLPNAKIRLPALPNAVWFFHASKQNYLSFRDNLPAHGMLAGTFSSLIIPSIFSLAAIPFVPLLFFPPAARILRTTARWIIKEDSYKVEEDWREWHQYRIHVTDSAVQFYLNGDLLFETNVVPQGRLGFVLWIDNQYLALNPQGTFRFGALKIGSGTWLEIQKLEILRD